MSTKSDNIEIMMGSETNDIIKELKCIPLKIVLKNLTQK